MGTTARHRATRTTPGWTWFGLGAVAVVLAVWWWSLIQQGPVAPAAAMPFVLPLTLFVRGILRGGRGAAVWVGVPLGLTLAGATGRGIVFTLLSLAAVGLELASSGHRTLAGHLLLVTAGFVCGMLLLIGLLSLP